MILKMAILKEDHEEINPNRIQMKLQVISWKP